MLPVVSIAPLSTLALAVFRVALGAVVLLDLAESIPDHCDFYSCLLYTSPSPRDS